MTKYYEVIICLCLKNDIFQNNVQEELSKFINYILEKDVYLSAIHLKKQFKQYSFSDLIPYEKDLLYKSGEIYTFKVRSWNKKFSNKFAENLHGSENNKFIIIGCSMKEYNFNSRIIHKIRSITPVIVTMRDYNTNRTRAWINGIDKKNILESIILNNLQQKYNTLNNTSYEFKFESVIKEIKILKCLKTKYKKCKFISYRLEIYFYNSLESQSLAQIAYVSGIGGKNSSIGAGFSCIPKLTKGI